MMKSARVPLVIHSFWPEMTRSPPSMRARVFSAATSGAAAGFADAERGDGLAAVDSRTQELVLLLPRSEFGQHRQRDLGLHHERHAYAARIGIRHGFHVGGAGPPIQAQTAPFRIDADAEKTQVGGLLEQLAREDAARSHSSAWGAISSRQNRLTVCLIMSCSSVKCGNSLLTSVAIAMSLILRSLLSADLNQHLAGRHHLPGLHQDGLDHTVDCSANRLFHFHGLENYQRIARSYFLPFPYQDAQDLAGHGCVGGFVIGDRAVGVGVEAG